MRSALGLILLLLLGLVLALALGVWMTAHHLRRPPRKTYAWALGRNLPGDPSELERSLEFDELSLDLRGDDPLLRGFGLSPVWDIAGDDPDGPVIVWTPGWGDSRVGSLARVRWLAPVARRVIVWDSPGQGEAGGKWPMAVREDRMLVRLAEWAHETYRSDLVLAGSSMGAGLSMVGAATLAERQSEVRVIGVIAEAPYGMPQTPAQNYLRAIGHPHNWNIRAVYALMGWRLGAGADWSKAHDGKGFDRVAWAGRLRCPLLVVHGDQDVISPPEDGRAIAARAERGSLAMIEGAGHNNLWLRPEYASRCASAVGEFVRGLRPSSAKPTYSAPHG